MFVRGVGSRAEDAVVGRFLDGRMGSKLSLQAGYVAVT